MIQGWGNVQRMGRCKEDVVMPKRMERFREDWEEDGEM